MKGNLVKNLFHSDTHRHAIESCKRGDKSPIWYFYSSLLFLLLQDVRGEIEWDETFKLFLSMSASKLETCQSDLSDKGVPLPK